MKTFTTVLKNYYTQLVGAALLLLITVVLFSVGQSEVGVASLCIFTAYAVLVGVYIFRRRDRLPERTKTALSSLTVDMLMKFDTPVLIVAEDDSILWYNTAFSGIEELSQVRYGDRSDVVADGTFKYSVLKEKDANFDLKVGERSYNVSSNFVKMGGKDYYLTLWHDVTELEAVKSLLKKRNVVVGYAAIDNASEVMPYIQDKYRSSVAKVYSELSSWVAGMNGIMQEYDRDKYIIFIDEEYFEPNIGKKFDILDRINDVVLEDGSNRITISMSFAHMNGSLSEKEAAARGALEYAFQRGGAQVIVKTLEGNVSYGGASRAVEKTTKIKSRVTADRLKEMIKESSNVLIMGHRNVDYDAIAACAAVFRLCSFLGAKANIIVNPDDSALQSAFLLLESVDEYKSVFVDKVLGQELLTPSSLVVIVDASNPKVFESPEIYENAENIAIIDHHVQTNEFENVPKLQYIDPTASSASELLCEILEQAIPRVQLKNPEAELLLAGILLDTQRFTRNTGIRTFGAAMYLHPDASALARSLALFKPSIEEYTKLAVFQKNTVVFREIIAISHYDGDNSVENRVMASIAAENMLNIASIRAAFTLCRVGTDIHISGRSDGSINVSKILEQLNGGGRFEAAATVMKSVSLEDAMKQLRAAIEEYWNEKFST